MPPSHQYRKRDYEFANTFVTLRTTVGLTQQGLAKHLGISSRAVENWEQGLTAPTDYLQIYQQHQYQVLTRRGRQASGYPDSVATTWSLAFERIEKRNKAAAELLRLCAFVAPDQIPEELLIEGATFWPATLQEAVRDRWRFNQMLATLLDFSLIKRVGRERQLSLHRLVQVVQQARMTPEEQGQWAQRVVYAVNVVFPRDPENEVVSWPLCQRLLEQALACDTLIQQHGVLLPQAADILHRAGIYLREHALYPQAWSLLQRALSLREHLLGAQHPNTAQSLHDLATLYLQQGKYPQAEPLLQRALSIREQHLGSEHLETANLLHDFADFRLAQGQIPEAVGLYQRVLTTREHILGSDHPLTLETRTRLEAVLATLGQKPETTPTET